MTQADEPLLDRTRIQDLFRSLGASPEHLLAMKTLAARRDTEDLRFLVVHLGLTSPEEVIAVCTRVFPAEPLPDRARLVLEDVFEEIGRTRD